jgi:hypothetical protein
MPESKDPYSLAHFSCSSEAFQKDPAGNFLISTAGAPGFSIANRKSSIFN